NENAYRKNNQNRPDLRNWELILGRQNNGHNQYRPVNMAVFSKIDKFAPVKLRCLKRSNSIKGDANVFSRYINSTKETTMIIHIHTVVYILYVTRSTAVAKKTAN